MGDTAAKATKRVSVMEHRRIGIDTDKDCLLEFHCVVNYVSSSPWAKNVPFEQFREKWFGTSQTTVYLSDLAESMEHERTIAEIWEIHRATAGYVWAVFNDVPEYDFTFVELIDLAVAPDFRRRGLASQMVSHVEELSRARAAKAVYSSAAWESARLASTGFEPWVSPQELRFEKLLVPEDEV